MIGKPKYKEGDTVRWTLTLEDGTNLDLVGEVYIVDAWGTFGQNEEPSYDIMVEHEALGGRCLVKHVRESGVENAN